MRLFQIDAFTDAPFKGNPAAVCLLDGATVDETWMQNVATEMNLSETAFVQRQDGDWSIRWFSPTIEIALCGHATLATAHALREDADLENFAGRVADSGEGRWTVQESIEQGIPAPVLSLALMARFESQGRADYAGKLLAMMRKSFGGHAITRKDGATS